MVRRLIAPGLATLVGLAVLVSLGVWQLQRLAWKEALIARVESRLDQPPVAAPGPLTWPGLDVGDLEYAPVVVHGRYLNDREAHVVRALTEPKGPLGGIGYDVVTPLQTDAGWIVWVNRGFVPAANKLASTRQEGLVEGETTVVGLVRRPRGRAWYEPGDGVSDNEWFSRDPVAWAPYFPLPSLEIAPYLIDARREPDLPGGLPQGGETIVRFPNSHLGYAITWFGLAAALAVIFGVFAWRRVKGRSE